MSRTLVRMLAVLLALTLVAAALRRRRRRAAAATTAATAASPPRRSTTRPSASGTTARATRRSSRCVVGLMTTFESPVDLPRRPGHSRWRRRPRRSTSAAAPTARASRCTTCDDGANLDQARRLRPTSWTRPASMATVNDQGTAGQAEVSAGDRRRPASPGSPATSRTTTGATRTPTRSTRPAPARRSCMPQALIDADATEIGIIRVDSAGAGAMQGLLERHLRGRRRDLRATTPRCPAGTTDFTPVHPGRRGRGRHRRRCSPSASRRPSRSCGPASSSAPSSSSARSLGTFSHAGDRRARRLRRADGVHCGPSRRRRPTCRCTTRCAATWRPPARRRSRPRTSRPARCGRGSGSTPCST